MAHKTIALTIELRELLNHSVWQIPQLAMMLDAEKLHMCTRVSESAKYFCEPSRRSFTTTYSLWALEPTTYGS